MLKKRSIEHKEFMFIMGVFIISVAIRFWIGAFFKNVHVYPDGLMYYQMAESFAQGRGFRIYNYEYPFRILYSICIAPAFLIKERHVQQAIIQLINCLMICSTFIPYALIARKVINNQRLRRLAYVMFIICPDLHFSVTFMTENVYMPLSMWTILLTMHYVWNKPDKKDKAGRIINLPVAAGLGILFYLLYMTKSSGVLMIPMVEGMLIADGLRESYINKSIKIIACRIVNILVSMAIFLGLKAVGDRTWMYLGEGTSFVDNKIKDIIEIIISRKYILVLCGSVVFIAVLLILKKLFKLSEKVIYLISAILLFTGFILITYYSQNATLMGALYIMICIVIGSGVLPLLLPGVFFDRLNEKAKKLYTFVMIVVSVGTFALAIHARQTEFDHSTLWVHFRFILYIWLLIQLCFYSFLETKERGSVLKKTLIFAIPVIVCAVIFKGINDWSTMDQTALYYIVRFLNDRINILRIMLIIVAFISVYLIMKHKRMSIIAFLCIYICLQLVNNLLVLKYHYQDYYLPEESYKAIKVLEDRIENDKEHDYMLVYERTIFDKNQKIADTFTNKDNVYTVNYEELLKRCKINKWTPSYEYLPSVYHGAYDKDLFDYIIIRNDTQFEWDSNMLMKESGNDEYIWQIYKLNDPYTFPLLRYKQ